MGKLITGEGRVNALPLLYDWQERTVCILAHASTGAGNRTAVIGYVPYPEIPDADLRRIAERHGKIGEWGKPAAAYWLINTGHASRIIPKPGHMHVNAKWQLETEWSATLEGPSPTFGGYSSLVTGRFAFEDPNLMEQARELLSNKHLP
ncbi:hypothetical protein [Streptomyces sp. CC53]|uniref:hypothetical protein n=1 Tax=Streptomyces sp. CC53 TaxID=1906740 RepID=UPI00115FBD43|nr:hypothetical protein [Streptomyces sp. CC53]